MKIAMGLLLVVLLVSCGGRREAEPTVVPVPTFTNTPETVPPTIAPAATATPDTLQVYRVTVARAGQDLANGMSEVAALSLEPKVNDPTWRASVSAAAARTDLGYKSLIAIEPPQELTDFHAQLLDAAQICNVAVGSFALGIERNDETLLNVGLVALGECNEKFSAAITAAEEVFQ